MSSWFCNVAKGLRADRELQHTWAQNTQTQTQPSAFSQSMQKTKKPLCKLGMFLRHSHSPSPLQTCQVWLSSMSRMNRQRPISLHSFFLTTPRNHLLAIFLTSLMTDRLLSAFPVPVRFLLPLLYSSLHSVFWQSSVCVSGVFTVQKVVPVEWRVQETWAKRVAVGFIQLCPQWANLRWDFEELNGLWTTLSHFSILWCSSLCCLSFPSHERIRKVHHVPEIIQSNKGENFLKMFSVTRKRFLLTVTETFCILCLRIALNTF